jgi:hypothetical protein
MAQHTLLSVILLLACFIGAALAATAPVPSHRRQQKQQERDGRSLWDNNEKKPFPVPQPYPYPVPVPGEVER